MGNCQRLRQLPRRLTAAMALITPINTSLCLEQLCASNFQKLLQLIPDLAAIKNAAVGVAPRHANLHLTVIDHSPYTLTVELNHCFSQHLDGLLAPALRIRIYMDAQLAEVLSDNDRASVARTFPDARQSREIMHYKWRLNYFLQKWLDHCLGKNYRFTS